MAKRFTDTDKWKDDWFLSLTNDQKVIWIYILDTCNHAGIIKKNMRMLNFCCNTNISNDEFMKVFEDRVLDFEYFYLLQICIAIFLLGVGLYA